VVHQDAMLFSTSIRENLCFGKQNATEKEMWEALENANGPERAAGREAATAFGS